MSGSELNIFDAQFATNQFSGNQLLLIQILEKFIQQYQNFDTLLVEQLQQENFLAAKQDVHTIKGVCGNLGMKALHHACRVLEGDLANPKTEFSLESFLQVFKQTIAQVQSYSAENTNKESSKAPPEDEKTSLIAVLKRNEFISEGKMQSYTQSLDLSPEKLNELKQAIDNLDYASAIQLLQ